MLGSLGSGKTASIVRELCKNPSQRITYSNIETKGIKNNILISPEMIVKKELVNTKKSGEQVFKYSLNVDFWQKAVKKHGSINVVLDEAHTLIDSRRAMSNLNKVMNDFMALLRRVVGQDSRGYGELILISQLERRLDIVAKELSTNVYYHVCYYDICCSECGFVYQENNETPQKAMCCLRCSSYDIKRDHFFIMQFRFRSITDFINWKYFGKKTYYSKLLIEDIMTYFPMYNTLQWSNLLSEL